MLDRTPELEGERWIGVALTLADAPALQAFLDANPLYSELCYGRPWRADDAVRELADRPPPDWPQGASHGWAVLERPTGRWLGLITFTEDLLADHVWHLGLFLIATAEHGSGLAHEVYAAWQAHAARRGARWLRLGVVCVNPRAFAFWKREGFVEVRRRHGLKYGDLVQSVSVQIKPIGDATIEQHLVRVPRDREDSARAKS